MRTLSPGHAAISDHEAKVPCSALACRPREGARRGSSGTKGQLPQVAPADFSMAPGQGGGAAAHGQGQPLPVCRV